ncbi:MAG: acyl-CoA/acyl-ACP dehydrogenase [Hyphomicrobiales bacterium]|nr:acyl-CoA/acyl-ACP dehydrogenase [Hyphomicrobiales bacterium]
MNFELDKHHLEIQEQFRAVATTVVAETARKHDTDASVPVEMMAALHDAGLYKLCVPQELGGNGTSFVNGHDPLPFLIGIEEIARADMGSAHCFQVHGHSCMLLSHACQGEQLRRYLEPVVDHGASLSWTGSEPGRTARGQYNLQSDAIKKDGGYLVNGIKNYGTNASVAEWNIVALSSDQGEMPDNFLLVMIPAGAEGFEVDASWWDPTGMRSAVSPKLTLSDVFVADGDVLVGPGYYPRERLGSRWHLGFGASHLGAAQGMFDFILEYLPQRRTTGDPHSQRAIGEMKMRLAAARDMLYHGGLLWSGNDLAKAEEYSLMAKLYCIMTAEWMVSETIRVVGSTALLRSFDLERAIRDIHIHSTHANLYSTAQLIGRSALGLEFDATQQQIAVEDKAVKRAS